MTRYVFALTLAASVLEPLNAALSINVGRSIADGSGTDVLVIGGQGPTGADSNYQAFNGGGHETSSTGNLQTFTGTTFAGIGGTYSVGVTFTWPDTGSNAVKQAFGRLDTTDVNFFETWIGADSRGAQGGNGVGSATTTRLTFTGLPTNATFTLTSHHFDNRDQTGLFTTNLTGATTFDIGAEADAGFADDNDPNPLGFSYDFTLTSDGSGTASIDYIISEVSGDVQSSFFVINGFNLAAIPEPSSLVLVGLGGLLLARRRR